MTTAGQIRKLQEDRSMRKVVDSREELLHRLHRDDVEAARITADDRVESKRLLKAQQQMALENDTQMSLLRMERDRMVKQDQAEQEDKLARELQRRHVEVVKEEKERQHIRETSQEIRELESKLKAAYTSKERAAQIAHKQAKLAAENGKDSEMVRKMREANERAAQLERECAERLQLEKVRYQMELERQLEQQELTKQEAFKHFMHDKLMIDEIVRKIHEEDQREVEREMRKKQMTQQYMQEFLETREVWKKKERERMEEENRRIQEYAKLTGDRERSSASNKQSREEALDKVRNALSDQIAKKDRDLLEMETIRQELRQVEEEEKARLHQKMEAERKIRERLERQKSRDEDMFLKGLRVQAEQEEEQQFVQQMLNKMAEDDRIEQMNAEKRRMKKLEHKRALQDLLDERRAQFAAERELEALERKREMEMEEERKRKVEEERKRLLKEHAVRLLGHLPRGVIQGEEDLQMLGPEFAQAYNARCVDPFEESLWQ